MKSRRARGTREETLTRGARPVSASSLARVLVRLASLAQIGQLARRLPLGGLCHLSPAPGSIVCSIVCLETKT